MKRWDFSCYTLSSCLAVALLVGCGGSQPQVVPGRTGRASANEMQVMMRPNAAAYKVIHSFQGEPDGQDPQSVSFLNSSLLGTTFEGGSNGFGAVFQSTSGKVHVIYSFAGGSDGVGPEGSLTSVQGSYYGTTSFGGGTSCSGGCGTIFAIDSSGKEHVIYRLKSDKSDGWEPNSALVPLNSAFYGSAPFSAGSQCYQGCGTIFSVTASGKFRVIYRFKNGKDGCYPYTLVTSKGSLYGITASGGTSGCSFDSGGTIFSLTTSGTKKILHEFKGRSDGASPSSLIIANGVLYGTTISGGNGYGVVFSLTRSGAEKVIYTFQGGADGSQPGALLFLNGTLYGTTRQGGTGPGNGYGTLFSLTLSGSKTTLHLFKGHPDGLSPNAIAASNGTIYGVTSNGGSSEASVCGAEGCGTLYRLAP